MEALLVGSSVVYWESLEKAFFTAKGAKDAKEKQF
jgi:hypothetical protein